MSQHTRMIQRLVTATLLFAAMFATAAEPAGKLAEARGTLEKWVETRQLVSKTRGDWQTDKETIEQTIALFERELKGVEEQMAKLNTNSSQVEKGACRLRRPSRRRLKVWTHRKSLPPSSRRN